MAQACHGALESGKRFYDEPNCNPDSVIVIGVKNQKELLKAQERINGLGIDTIAFWEPDWDYGFTSFGTEPLSIAKSDNLRRYQLWKV